MLNLCARVRRLRAIGGGGVGAFGLFGFLLKPQVRGFGRKSQIRGGQRMFNSQLHIYSRSIDDPVIYIECDPANRKRKKNSCRITAKVCMWESVCAALYWVESKVRERERLWDAGEKKEEKRGSRIRNEEITFTIQFYFHGTPRRVSMRGKSLPSTSPDEAERKASGTTARWYYDQFCKFFFSCFNHLFIILMSYLLIKDYLLFNVIAMWYED